MKIVCVIRYLLLTHLTKRAYTQILHNVYSLINQFSNGWHKPEASSSSDWLYEVGNVLARVALTGRVFVLLGVVEVPRGDLLASFLPELRRHLLADEECSTSGAGRRSVQEILFCNKMFFMKGCKSSEGNAN